MKLCVTFISDLISPGEVQIAPRQSAGVLQASMRAHLHHLEYVCIGMPPFCAGMEMICSSQTFIGINVGTSALGL